MSKLLAPLAALALAACAATSETDGSNPSRDFGAPEDSSVSTHPGAGPRVVADVTAVRVQGQTFSVTLESPDTGCDQYADWWEVLSLDGELLYRRILAHSHVDEQPFTRSGGPVPAAGQEVIVRAHMNTGGYGGQAMQGGSVDFRVVALEPDFASDVEGRAPQPGSCAF